MPPESSLGQATKLAVSSILFQKWNCFSYRNGVVAYKYSVSHNFYCSNSKIEHKKSPTLSGFKSLYNKNKIIFSWRNECGIYPHDQLYLPTPVYQYKKDATSSIYLI